MILRTIVAQAGLERNCVFMLLAVKEMFVKGQYLISAFALRRELAKGSKPASAGT